MRVGLITRVRPTRHWLTVLLLSYICLGSAIARTQDSFSVRTWQIPDGSTNTVFGVVQSPDGYLWIGTTGGLSQFDGVDFQTHLLGAPLGLSDSRVRMLLASKTSGLWVALDGAVVLLRTNQPPIVVKENVPPQRVETMQEDRTGALWLGYRTGPLCRIAAGKAETFNTSQGLPRSNSPIPSLAIDNQGQLWLAPARTSV